MFKKFCSIYVWVFHGVTVHTLRDFIRKSSVLKDADILNIEILYFLSANSCPVLCLAVIYLSKCCLTSSSSWWFIDILVQKRKVRILMERSLPGAILFLESYSRWRLLDKVIGLNDLASRIIASLSLVLGSVSRNSCLCFCLFYFTFNWIRLWWKSLLCRFVLSYAWRIFHYDL